MKRIGALFAGHNAISYLTTNGQILGAGAVVVAGEGLGSHFGGKKRM